MIEFSVTDTGNRYPPEFIETDIPDFVQVDSQSSAACEGSGLGLALMSELAQLLGGDVSVDSVCRCRVHVPSSHSRSPFQF
jgi:signal transduction histidine kinase